MIPKISIIIPVYKVEKYLRRCVDSALSQTLSEIEIILVDDGSPDNCPQICDSYCEKDTRVHVIHKTNGGLASARNAGMKIASGEYIFFLDSDDWLETDGMEVLYRTAEKYHVDFVRFRAIRSGWPDMPEDAPCMLGEPREMRGGYYSKERIKKEISPRLIATSEMTLGPIVGVWESLYNKRFLEEHGITFFEDIQYSEDVIFSALVVEAASSFYYLDNACVYHYFYNSNSISKSFRQGRWESCKLSIEMFERIFGNKGAMYQRQIEILTWFYIFLSLNERKYLTGNTKIRFCKNIIEDEVARKAKLIIPGLKVGFKLKLQMIAVKLDRYHFIANL